MTFSFSRSLSLCLSVHLPPLPPFLHGQQPSSAIRSDYDLMAIKCQIKLMDNNCHVALAMNHSASLLWNDEVTAQAEWRSICSPLLIRGEKMINLYLCSMKSWLQYILAAGSWNSWRQCDCFILMVNCDMYMIWNVQQMRLFIYSVIFIIQLLYIYWEAKSH